MNKENTLWLLWSIEHQAWWKPDFLGYTTQRAMAGKYSYAVAVNIVLYANIGKHDKPNEAMIPYEKI